jgi:hypothetical protein
MKIGITGMKLVQRQDFFSGKNARYFLFPVFIPFDDKIVPAFAGKQTHIALLYQFKQ